MSETIQVTHEGPVTVIRINRPEVRNAVNETTAKALRTALLKFDADPAARVAVMTGGDDVFCAGADLNEIDGLAAAVEGNEGPMGFTRLLINKPTIAAVAGYCVAGGLEIACWCDLRIADETAVFGCFERRFGVPLVDGGTQRLPRIIGMGRALEMILTGRAVSSQEAHMWGLVNEVVARGQHIRRAVEIGQRLAQFPQTCMRNDRHAVYAGSGQAMAEALRTEARLGALTLASGETAAGVHAFVSGRGRSGRFESG